MNRFRQDLLWPSFFLILAMIPPPARCADVSNAAMLYLQDGDFMAGGLAECEEAGIVRWQMRGATRPFDFPSAALRAVHFPSPEKAPAPTGDYLFELACGDLLYGSLVSMMPEHIELETSRLGRLRVAREEVRRITRWSGTSPSEYRGPNGLAEWQPTDEGQWREEAGQLITSEVRARLQKKLSIPTKARIEFEISGGGDLEFTFIVSAGTSDGQLQQGFRFEVWHRSVVVLRELQDRADLAAVYEFDDSENRLQLQALVDQKRGTMSVHALNGKQLAAIELPSTDQGEEAPLEWITMLNGRGELRLELIAVGPWDGQLPPQIEPDKAGLCRSDGTVLYGEVIGYDTDTAKFTVRTGESEEQRVAADDVAVIFTAPAPPPEDEPFHIGLHDGTRISGNLAKVADDRIYLSRRGVEESLACAIGDVRSIIGLNQGGLAPESRPFPGRLELDGVRCQGSLIAATSAGENTCLVWQPQLSSTGSPLERNISGRIVYRDSVLLEPGRDSPRARQRQLQLQIKLQRLEVLRRQAAPQQFRVDRRALQAAAAAQQGLVPPKPNGAGTLHLVAGDRIPCEAAEIDEEGVHFESTVVDTTFVPHSAVKAVELGSNWAAVACVAEKRERLLTVPRLQRNNPPTHLVASTGGDMLRTNVLSLNAETLEVESRLETKRIPRDRVACVIWLHDATKRAEKAPPSASDAPDAPLVQAVREDGVRLTFVPQECTGPELIGASDLLGVCRLELRKVDALVFGDRIQTLADEHSFHNWKLADAVDPRYVNEAAQASAGASSSAAGSGLIGKPAPDFRLDLLDGGEFQLTAQKGQIVVLDFWASWCGPCMQALPQVDAVAAEFAGQGVKLVAINMQEDPAAAASALERLKIKPIVALDTDGAAAGHYQVTAIPHTVVIDRDGNVAELFIGSSSNFAAQLRASIEGLLTRTTK